MRFVPVKSTAQQDLQSLHRVRSQLIHSRTALANEIRSLLGEYGITIAKELRMLRRALPLILEDQDNGLSGVFRETLAKIMERLRFLDERIRTYEQRVKRLFDQDERCQRLADIQGVGPPIATALVAAVGNAREFRSGRELSAWLGLVPRQQSSGGRRVLLGITKRGDRYLRMLLIHGARAAVRYAEGRTDPGGVWISRLKARRGPNVAAVAVANKNARVAWKLLSSGEHYLPLPPRPRDRTDIGARAPRAPRPADWPARCTARRHGSETGGFPAALQVIERAGENPL
jgi:transposase